MHTFFNTTIYQALKTLGLYHRNEQFNYCLSLQGTIYREVKNRKTLEFALANQNYFIKIHRGISIFTFLKNLFPFHHTPQGATDERKALQALTAIGVKVPTVAGFGRKGWLPTRAQSFIITEKLIDTVTLEDHCRDWARNKPSIKAKRALIAKVANAVSRMHQQGINHRDCYLCHFHLHRESGDLYMMDFHRAQCRRAVPKRWLIKDLAGLLFSALDCGLTHRDLLYFIKVYRKAQVKTVFAAERYLWQTVLRKALLLYRKHLRTQSYNTDSVLTAQAEALRAQGRDHALPKDLVLTSATDQLHCQTVLRVVPSQRVVIEGRWQKQPVVAKAFYGKHRLAHVQREIVGQRAMQAMGVLTPAILHTVISADLCIVVYERITATRTVETLPDLEELLDVMAKQHRGRLYQDDLHFDNFLLTEYAVYAIDPGSIRIDHTATPFALKNLALFLGQLPLKLDPKAPHLITYYFQKRGWSLTPCQREQILEWRDDLRKSREKRFLKKIFRSSTQFHCEHTFNRRIIYDREYGSPAFEALLEDLDGAIQRGTILKAGNTCTVAKIVIDDCCFVIKRYNIKHFFHGLKRALQRTRAAVSWRNAHRLRLYGINTPKPVALVEKRCGIFRCTSYYLSEYVEGMLLSECTESSTHTLPDPLLEQMAAFFRQCQSVWITHGDLKATNFIVNDDGLSVLDLDSMKRHQGYDRFIKSFNKDLARFNRN